jgi:hypothetical protein
MLTKEVESETLALVFLAEGSNASIVAMAKL